MIQDLLIALRSLRRRPVSSSIIVASLALGIGANTALLSWVDALLWRPLPGLVEPDRLVAVWGNRHDEPANLSAVSYLNFLDYQAEAPSLVGLEAVAGTALTLTHKGLSQRYPAARNQLRVLLLAGC